MKAWKINLVSFVPLLPQKYPFKYLRIAFFTPCFENMFVFFFHISI